MKNQGEKLDVSEGNCFDGFLVFTDEPLFERSIRNKNDEPVDCEKNL